VIVPGVLSGGGPDEPLPVIGPSYLAVVQRSGVGLYVHLAVADMSGGSVSLKVPRQGFIRARS